MGWIGLASLEYNPMKRPYCLDFAKFRQCHAIFQVKCCNSLWRSPVMGMLILLGLWPVLTLPASHRNIAEGQCSPQTTLANVLARPVTHRTPVGPHRSLHKVTWPTFTNDTKVAPGYPGGVEWHPPSKDCTFDRFRAAEMQSSAWGTRWPHPSLTSMHLTVHCTEDTDTIKFCVTNIIRDKLLNKPIHRNFL